MANTCAWCKINTDKQQKFEADGNNTGCCPLCKSYNDIGQKTIEINSMKQIYRETVRLMDEMALIWTISGRTWICQRIIRLTFALTQEKLLKDCFCPIPTILAEPVLGI